MNCANCNHDYTKVKETRVIPEQPRWSKRRRLCLECGHQFWTIEMPAEDVVVSEDEGDV
jgi:transcriptional regulator NrdR family protein